MPNVIDDQIAYYRARAPEYDAEIVRFGGYGGSIPHGDLNERELVRNEQFAVMKGALRELGPVTSALELACGTGNWTSELTRLADEVVAVDSSPEMLGFNQLRLASAKVAYYEADLFRWRPERQFDLVFFGFWLTHIPAELFAPFWEMVRSCLVPGGRVFFVDNLTDDSASAEVAVGDGLVRRRLKDGREFQLVKIYYTVPELVERIESLGWSVRVRTCGQNYLYGIGGRQ